MKIYYSSFPLKKVIYFIALMPLWTRYSGVWCKRDQLYLGVLYWLDTQARRRIEQLMRHGSTQMRSDVNRTEIIGTDN